MKKKITITLSGIIGAILIISLILLIVLIKSPQMGIQPSGIQTTSTNLIEKTDYGAKYSFQFSSDVRNRYTCEDGDFGSISVIVSPVEIESRLPDFIEGLQENVEFETKEVEFSGVGAVFDSCSDRTRDARIEFNNTRAFCKAQKGLVINNTPRAEITCRFYGEVYAYDGDVKRSASFYGLSGGKAIVHIFKEGFNCFDGNEKCEGTNHYICQGGKFVNEGEIDGKCGFVAIEKKQKFYRLNEDDTCLEVEIYGFQKTDKDYSTLEECIAQTKTTDVKKWVAIIIGITLLIGIAIVILIAIKRK